MVWKSICKFPKHLGHDYMQLSATSSGIPSTLPTSWSNLRLTSRAGTPYLAMVVHSPDSGHRQLQWAGNHPHWYNTHSFRIGDAPSAAEAGASQAATGATVGSTSASSTSTGIDSTNVIHALSRTDTQVAAHKYTHTLYGVALYITMLAGFTLGFSPHVKRVFFPWEPEGLPKFSISLVGPAIHLVITPVPTQIGLLGGFNLGCYPCGLS